MVQCQRQRYERNTRQPSGLDVLSHTATQGSNLRLVGSPTSVCTAHPAEQKKSYIILMLRIRIFQSGRKVLAFTNRRGSHQMSDLEK